MKHFRIAAALALLALAGCTGAQFQSGLTKTNTWFNTYGPIIGRDLIMVSNILIRAECSPGLASASGAASNVLNVVAPNSRTAQTVKDVLSTNVDITNQLCPLVASIRATVGTVPAGTPSQVVTAPIATAPATVLPTN